MRTSVILFLFVVFGGMTTPSFAQFGVNGGNGGNGSNGNGGNAVSGMPGCDGGTQPAADGKFYLSGTQQECNPSDEDRASAQRTSK
ncbi:hypothetical protein AYJ56_01055 [Brucella anthropi]|nr:hypothetical protein AYJ56_01055 [Brucella anthropi]